ncbi:hypothetical protein, partial [Oceanisphaera psychrotolerans]|uniref:hypothetical protein n=1 Tax=Oceanisphaera psychrotolerans TaxID=1414654 RepID=UPI001C314EDE
APMIVWQLPCESRSLPGTQLKSPILTYRAFFVFARIRLTNNSDGIGQGLHCFGYYKHQIAALSSTNQQTVGF